MKNKGFSMVELIIVVAILAILGAGTITMSGAHYGWRVNKCAELMESTMSKTMTQAMSLGSVKGMLIYQKNGVYYAVIVKESCAPLDSGVYTLEDTNTVQRIELGKDPIKITAVYREVGTSVEKQVVLSDHTTDVGMTDVAEILYDRGSGAISSVKIGTADYRYDRFEIECHGKEAKIKIHAATGKHIRE